MGPDAVRFANLSPVNATAVLKGITGGFETSSEYVYPLFSDGSEAMTADVWNIFYIGDRLRNQKLLQFKITNNSGGESDIECAFMRMV